VKILFLEPFFGGSHRDFALGFKAHSSHEITLVTLPDQYWKWRMMGAALYFVRRVKDFSRFDAVITTDMMDVAHFISLAGRDLPPVILYVHENQMSYPLGPHHRQDNHLGFTNITSALAADRVWFNSHFHVRAFMRSAKRLIGQMPDFQPGWALNRIREKTRVMYPGCGFEKGVVNLQDPGTHPPLIIWNHRWDYDKNPRVFFDVLARLKQKKIDFSLALVGEKPDVFPDVFTRAREELKAEIKVFGYLESREEYLSLLKQGTVAVSCAIQENFGMSIVEAVRLGCLPLLPDRLSYPEIMPQSLHSRVLYRNKKDLEDKLTDMLVNFQTYLPLRKILCRDMEKFSWERMIGQYDQALEKIKNEG
jgi:glycosyltransferase involved in cell wall biosynthesis